MCVIKYKKKLFIIQLINTLKNEPVILKYMYGIFQIKFHIFLCICVHEFRGKKSLTYNILAAQSIVYY